MTKRTFLLARKEQNKNIFIISYLFFVSFRPYVYADRFKQKVKRLFMASEYFSDAESFDTVSLHLPTPENL